MTAVIIDRGVLTPTMAAGDGNFIFSEPRADRTAPADHAGVKPLVMIATLPEALTWMSAQFRAVSENRGIENRIEELPEIYMTIDQYVQGKRFEGMFPINDALVQVVNGAMAIWGASEAGDPVLDALKGAFDGPEFIGPKLDTSTFRKVLEFMVEEGPDLVEGAQTMIEASGLTKERDTRARTPTQSIQIHVAQGLIAAAEDVATGKCSYARFKASFSKLEAGLPAATAQVAGGEDIQYYFRWHYLDTSRVPAYKAGAAKGAVHQTCLGKRHASWLGIYHIIKLLERSGALPSRRAAQKRGWFS
jgi:hypothetical protein